MTISDELQKEICVVSKLQRFGKLFENPLRAFRTALNESEITLPDGQCTHILRHTFAVHFMLARGNILDLQKILGHETLYMALRYAQ